MSDFLRPEARAALWRWRDVIGAALVLVFGLWLAFWFIGPLKWLGYGICLLGAAMALAGAQRARFRRGNDGPGVVQVDERRLAYFGPLTGGVIDIADLTRVELEPVAYPAPHWVLTGLGGDQIAIPVTAEGAEALFDVFATLPDMRTDRLLRVLERTPDARITVWSLARPLLH